jgi:hypothetical protein
MECRHTDPFILLYDGKISDSADILPILTKVNEQKKPIVIVADNVDGPALQMLVINVHKGAMPWVAVKTPGFAGQKKEYLYDIAALTGADVISSEMGTNLENCTIDNLGKAKSVIINKECTTIIGGEGDDTKIEDRISQLKVTLSQVESDYEARILNERIAKLSGGVAIIKVGASTEAELIEKKYRYEDALAATRAAVEEGIVPGGGSTLLRISQQIESLNDLVDEDEKIGFEIVRKALLEPIRQIAFNAGISSDVVVDTVCSRENNIGLNARTGKYVDMIQEGIIRHTAVIALGGDIITEDIKDGCSIIKDQAEMLKIRFGSALASESRDNEIVSIPGLRGRDPKEISLKNLANIIQARMEDIIEHIYYEIKNSGFEKKLIAGIVVTGGGAKLKHVAQLIEYMTGMDTRIGYPNEHLAKGVEEVASPMYATAVGLVIKGFENSDLMRERMDPQAEEKEKKGLKPRSSKGGGLFSNFLEKTKQFFEDDNNRNS